MNYRQKILKIRSDYLQGRIDLETAKNRVKPLLELMNEKGAQISKEHGRKFTKLTFGYVFR